MISNYVIHQSYKRNVKKLLFLGSSCAYPKQSSQPIREDALLSGSLEPTSSAYAVAKIAGIVACQAYSKQYGSKFICAIPSNPFGPGDDFDQDASHVIPAVIRKIHNAKKNQDSYVEFWGTGVAKRDFIYVDDVAEACIHLMKKYDEATPINIGTGRAVSIRSIVEIIKEISNFSGEVRFDRRMSDGAPIKMLDTTKLSNLGWEASTELREGLRKTYLWYQENFG